MQKTSLHPPTPLAALALVSLLLASCQTVPMKNLTNPAEFARNLFRIAEDGDAKEWQTQLSIERRQKGLPYAAKHFEFWKKNLLEIEKTFGKPVAEQQFRVTDNRLEFEYDNKWYKLMILTSDEGSLKINED